MKMVSKAAFVLLAGGLATPALAGGLGDPVVTQPVVQPAPVMNYGRDWTGGYVGGQLGYGSIDPDDVDDDDGLLYGLRAGYDWDMGDWVIGLGADIDGTDVDFDNAFGSKVADIDYIARLKVRAGADMGQTLLYGTAGLAYAEGSWLGRNISDTGWFAGIGAEYMIRDQWSLGGELLTNQFDNFDHTGSDIDAVTATVNVSYHF